MLLDYTILHIEKKRYRRCNVYMALESEVIRRREEGGDKSQTQREKA